MVKSRDFSDRDTMGGKGYGSKSAGMGRGCYSSYLKNPAPAPERGGFDAAMISDPDRSKIMSMQKAEHAARESNRGKGSL